MKIRPAGYANVVDLDEVDLFDPKLYATGEPHLVWAAMRALAPLHRQVLPDGRAFWSVTRYDDACRVLGNHREFTSEHGSLLHQLGRGDAAAGKMLVSTDPPRHRELRRPLNRPLSARALVAHEDRIREAVRGVLRPALDNEEWDLAELSTELPMAVAGALMGLPERDWTQLVQWTAMAASPEEPRLRIGSGAATLAISHHGLFGYFAEQLQQRRGGNPGNDLIGHLTTMRAGGDRLTDEEVIYNCYSMLLGANATTPHSAAGTVLALIERPEEHRRALGLVNGLVEEGLRWTSPAKSFLRYAVDDVRLSGGQVRRGDAVAVWVGSANRDEDVFADPNRFDLARTDNRHIAFGFGAHYCLGAPLARLTLRMFFEEMLSTFADIELTGPVRHLTSHFIAGFTHLPVRTRLARTSAR